MKNVLLILFFIFQITTAQIFAAGEAFQLGQSSSEQIHVNNRILANVNGKAISVVDVMKQMDLMFYKQFPQYTSSMPARYQFYHVNWQRVLQDMIDKQIVLADAEEMKVTMTSGEIRKEMENLFGPNIILSLDKAGLTFEEAWKMIEEDLKLRRMIGIRAQSKAYKRVTPQVLKETYKEFAKTNILPAQWEYIVITIRNPDETLGAEVANFAYQFLVEQNKPLDKLPEQIEKNASFGQGTKVSISETFKHEEKDMNPSHKEALVDLTPGTYSKPLAQKSRKENEKIFRLFYLKSYRAEGAPSFEEISMRLRDVLLDREIDKETNTYLEKLRQHYRVDESHIKEMTSEDFAPFILK
jgi:SurA N-terminal domain